jgi:hypothetical protein
MACSYEVFFLNLMAATHFICKWLADDKAVCPPTNLTFCMDAIVILPDDLHLTAWT